MSSSIGYYTQIPFSLLSSISCSFLIILSLLYKKRLFNNYETRLVIILLIFYGGLSLSSLLPVLPTSEELNDNYIDSNCTFSLDSEAKYDPFCTIQGILIQFFSLSGIIWTGFINYVSYREIILKKGKMDEKLPLFITCILGVITSTVPLANVGYQESTCWCWFNIIENEDSDQEYLNHLKRFYWLGFFYIIAWIIICFILYVSGKIWIANKRNNADIEKYKTMIYIPIILVLCFIPLTISRCFSLGKMRYCGFFGFSIFSSCLMRLLGFFNSLVYGYHSEIRLIFFEVYRIEPDSAQSNEIDKKLGIVEHSSNLEMDFYQSSRGRI